MTTQDYKNAAIKLKEFSNWAKSKRFDLLPDHIKRKHGAMIRYALRTMGLAQEIIKASQPKKKRQAVPYI